MPPSAREDPHGAVRRWSAPAVCGLALAMCGLAGAQVDVAGDYLARMDTDGDGRVSLAEYQAWMLYAFERMDADGDGVLDPGEQPGGRAPRLTREAYLARLADRFNRQDADRDGYLDAAELAAPPR